MPNNESVFSSKRWKSIPIRDDKAWDDFIREMRENGTCPCECIKKINEEKKYKALKKGLDEVELKKVQQKIAALENGSEEELLLSFNPEIPSDIKELVEEIAHDMNIKGRINIYYGEENMTRYNDDGGDDLMLFNDNYARRYPNGTQLASIQRSTLRHELTHIKNQHSRIMLSVTGLIIEKAGLNIQNLIWASLFHRYYTMTQGPIEKRVDDVHKLNRAHESEADREPIACGTYENAKDAYIHRKFYLEVSQNMNQNDTFDPQHPSQAKRTVWSALIMRAKQAEQRLNDYENSYMYKIKKLFNTLGQQAKIGIAYFLLFFQSFIKNK